MKRIIRLGAALMMAPTLLSGIPGMGGAAVRAEQILVVPQEGPPSKIEVVRDLRYPTEFERPEINSTVFEIDDPVELFPDALVSTLTVMRPEPKDRIAYIAAMVAPYTQDRKYQLTPEEEKLCVAFSGKVVDEQGKPVKGATVRIMETMRYWALEKETAEDGTFNGKVWPGAVSVVAWHAGGPMTRINFDKGIPDGKCTISLTKGRKFRIQCVDEKNQPVEGAKLSLRGEERTRYEIVSATSKDGWATFSTVADGAVFDLTINSKDHLARRIKGIVIKGDDMNVPIRLTSARPYLLKVKEQGTGKPLEGVRLDIHDADPGADFVEPDWEDGYTTNEKGEVTLCSLEPGRLYKLSATSGTHSGIILIRLDDAMTSEAEISPRATVNLTITNIPPQPENKMEFTWFEMTGSGGSGASPKLEVKEGKAQFTHKFRRGSYAEYRFLNQEHKTEPLNTDVLDVELDYMKGVPDQKPTPVTVKLRPQDGEAPPLGLLTIQWNKDPKKLKKGEDGNGHIKAVLKNGETSFEIPRDATYYIHGERLLGGILQEWKESGGTKNFTANSERQVIGLRVLPAGAIRVQVTEADGRLAPHCRVDAKMQEAQNGNNHLEVQSNNTEQHSLSAWYATRPIPFSNDQTYYVQARCGFRYVISKERFKINADNYLQNVQLVLPPSQIRTVRVVDTEGRPLPGVIVKPNIQNSQFDYLHFSDWVTDQNGEYKFETNAINSEADTFSITVTPRNMHYQPLKSPVLMFPKGVATVTLKPGNRIFGRVVNTSRNKQALEHMQVNWSASAGKESIRTESVGLDNLGRFEFFDAPDKGVKLSFNSLPEGTEIHYILGSENVSADGKEIQVELRDKGPQKARPDVNLEAALHLD
ncbi:MAG: hypothetical protein ACAI35_11705 [Candidatus Methylacidiphilales bacterium]|nr:hypothetical protein [Candidatus Methylacidiphilales bacterium]